MNTYDRGIIGSMTVTFWQALGGPEAGGTVSRLGALENLGRGVVDHPMGSNAPEGNRNRLPTGH